VEALGELDARQYRLLRRAARWGRTAFGLAFAWKAARDPNVARYAPVVLYRTLGESLPEGMAPAASLWGLSQMFVRKNKASAARAGFGGSALAAGNKLFDAILSHASGVIYSVSEYADSWRAVRLPDNKINLQIDEMLTELHKLDSELPQPDLDYPFVLSAGERRSDTSNTSIRDASWHRRGTFGTLRMHPSDAQGLGCAEGDWVSITTRRGTAQAPVEFGDDLQPGHVALPNGHGLDYTTADGSTVHKGVSLNELTDTQSRDAFAGTPWHKYVPVRLARASQPVAYQETA
jgi:anaerobic selenocysteine-containing dehydrogenase